MEMANCLRCKKVFPRFSDPICDECKKKDEDLFKKVKDYLDDNPSSTVARLSEVSGASPKKIMTWLREGRLELADAEGGDLKCRQCNAAITSGSFCDSCLIEVNQQIENMLNDKPKIKNLQDNASKTGITMHTRNRK